MSIRNGHIRKNQQAKTETQIEVLQFITSTPSTLDNRCAHSVGISDMTTGFTYRGEHSKETDFRDLFSCNITFHLRETNFLKPVFSMWENYGSPKAKPVLVSSKHQKSEALNLCIIKNHCHFNIIHRSNTNSGN